MHIVTKKLSFSHLLLSSISEILLVPVNFLIEILEICAHPGTSIMLEFRKLHGCLIQNINNCVFHLIRWEFKTDFFLGHSCLLFYRFHINELKILNMTVIPLQVSGHIYKETYKEKELLDQKTILSCTLICSCSKFCGDFLAMTWL